MELWHRILDSPELLAALVGALVGGLASGLAALGGSLLINRRELSRKARIEIWNDLLPSLRSQWIHYDVGRKVSAPTPLPKLDRELRDLTRIATLAGSRDLQKSNNLFFSWSHLRILHERAENHVVPEEEFREAEREVDKQLWSLNRYIARKLR